MAQLFSTLLEPTARFALRLAGVSAAVVVALIAGGLVLSDSGMTVGGCLVLLIMPITIYLVAAARGPVR